ncbi:MAG TPA: four helix bundle protein [Gemmataceae bacterium]|jgi:four helix bundle protein|nr:four helix bundle protein [Gemmataceae bacterium]
MAVQNYKDLIAWRKAMDLVVEVYQTTTAFPNDERFGLTNQVRRAAVSIPSNIAEGQGRGPSQDFVRFLCIARGSLQEIDTQVILATRLDYIPQERYDRLSDQIIELAKVLNGLIRSIPT